MTLTITVTLKDGSLPLEFALDAVEDALDKLRQQPTKRSLKINNQEVQGEVKLTK